MFRKRGSDLFIPELAQANSTRESSNLRQKTAPAIEINKVCLKKPKMHILNPKLTQAVERINLPGVHGSQRS